MRALDIASLTKAYADGLTPEQLIREIYAEIRKKGDHPVWISLVPEDIAAARAIALQSRATENLPLYGVPFAVKDNIDVLGVTTTAACPDFAYLPQRSARVIELLEEAGAIVIGKTNLDQFATGLNGTRTPYGYPSSVFDSDYVSGGSSSGSAVSVASGLVAFSLGTDTAGSGRVPAAFNNIVGLKPTRGLFSTRGVVPACRSLDVVSVFAGTVGDALKVAEVAAAFDAEDPYSRAAPKHALLPQDWSKGFRFGVPDVVEFFGDTESEALFYEAVARLERLGGERIDFDPAPFRECASLLYAGPWVAERTAAVGDFARRHPDAVHPVVRDIVLGGEKYSAVDAFEGQYKLQALLKKTAPLWQKIDVMLVPSAPTIYKIEEMLADPVRLNSNLGTYTNFVNLMDLSALAVPAGFRPDGLPFGVTLVGRAFEDGALAGLGDLLHRALGTATVGGTARALPGPALAGKNVGYVEVAVVGAHLKGLPLHHQLVERRAKFVRTAKTAKGYTFYALPGTVPPKPGLVYDGMGIGGIEVEIWAVPESEFGSFVALIPAPLGIGTLSLDDGSFVKGFVCEAYAVQGAENITGFGGWKAYLASR
ncbi:allophanate hydrolase [Terrihabitans soli]|uniref:Allophanate hydrolase n=1 Tax=Terrihabitans soli TaxID=708113 RepID=A0A6S6QXS1_9HYPH|nr:allophanate hydrolase [Terrihabitans soli]BCJ92325.1 allophanate hydrolase [Terrihabitans soli]